MMEIIDIDLVHKVLYSLECAKNAQTFLPPLPPKMKPVYFRLLNAVYQIRDDFGCSRVSDINSALGFLLPNTTRFINEMVELSVLEKFSLASDKRVVLVRATDLGEEYIQEHIVCFNKQLEREFSKIGRTNCKIMIETITKVYEAMKKVSLGI